MRAPQLRGHVVVIGLGASGEAVAEYVASLARAGVDVRCTVIDERDAPSQRERAEHIAGPAVEVVLGTSDVPACDIVVASPGVPPHAPVMRAAKRLGVPVISELELAYRVSDSPWVAITGTNGKTTTTYLVAHLLDEAGVPSELAGNIGRPAISVAAGAAPDTVIVAEVSSFQLALTLDFTPRVALLLNVTEDHIDWHGSMDAYAADKVRVFANMAEGDVAVIDVDDPGSAPYASTVERQGVEVRRVSVAGLPSGGAGLIGESLTLDLDSTVTPIVERRELRIRGLHNVSNALAAAAAVSALGVTPDAIARGLRSFEPIAHRLEPVAVVGGVEYVNDSKATNPDAVSKAIAAFEGAPLVLLLGGRNKGNDFGSLAEHAAGCCRAVVAFGEAASDVAAAFSGTGERVLVVPRLADAVSAAAEIALPGDAVLLSPACASFDEFTGYDHRGREFKRLVAELGGHR